MDEGGGALQSLAKDTDFLVRDRDLCTESDLALLSRLELSSESQELVAAEAGRT